MTPRQKSGKAVPTATTAPAAVLHEETSTRAPHTSARAADPLPSDQFVLADVEFCRWVAAGFEKKKHPESARTWTELGLKIERVLVGEFAQFTKLERDLVVSLHTVAIKHAGVPGAQQTSRGCSRLGILIQWALRGSLEQLRAQCSCAPGYICIKCETRARAGGDL